MNHSQQIGYYFILAFLCTSLITLTLVLLLICRRKKSQSEEPISSKPTARAFTLTDIDYATEGFSPRRVIGRGRLGTVYAASSEAGELVAVKRIHPRIVLMNTGSDFSSRMKSLSVAQHPHVVSILGFSEGPGERIVVMEFVGVYSLDFYLHQNPDGKSPLDWRNRLKIAAAVARGLQYLHENAIAPNIVHGCVKPSNILIDENFSAKISDYGLNFLGPQERKGLIGYVDDEFWDKRERFGCRENDVYGFGVVLLEILSGRDCEEGLLVKWALPLIKEERFKEVFYSRIGITSDIKVLVRLAKVASACVGNSRRSRPSMGQVAAILNSLEIEVCV